MFIDQLKEIERLYDEGSVPEPEELEGEFYVVVPWFPWFSLELLKHRKSADIAGDGENLILDGVSFGKFRLEKGSDSLLIDYDQPENGAVMRGVVDRLRRLPDGRLVGKLYYKLFGQEIFMMFFEMRKK
jgi:hypothetical protein